MCWRGGEGSGGDKCYCQVNVKHLYIAGVKGRDMKKIDKRIDMEGERSAGGVCVGGAASGSSWRKKQVRKRDKEERD